MFKKDKKGLRQCVKLQICVGVIVVIVMGKNKVPSYFVGFAQKQFKQNPYLSLVDRDYEHFVFSVQFKKRQTDRQNQ